jgi:hypothetical protein
MIFRLPFAVLCYVMLSFVVSFDLLFLILLMMMMLCAAFRARVVCYCDVIIFPRTCSWDDEMCRYPNPYWTG